MSKATHISIMQLLQMFDTNEKSVEWLENLRWAGQPVCTHCGSLERITVAKSKKNTYWCGNCRKHFTVKTGTIMEGSNLPIQKWVVAIYYFMTARKGISSLQLSKELGITQKSAWFMSQRIRAACSGTEFKLEGIVEIDETYIGGKEKNKHAHKKTKGTQGRSTKTKTAVVGMRSRDGKVKAMSMFEKINSVNMQNLIDKHIHQGSTISTDEALFYKKVQGYRHIMVNHSVSEFVNGMASTNGIESVWAVLKRGYNGTFHHFSKKHLDRYVDEFTFRLNQGNVKIDTMDRIEAVANGAFGKRLRYKDLIG